MLISVCFTVLLKCDPCLGLFLVVQPVVGVDIHLVKANVPPVCFNVFHGIRLLNQTASLRWRSVRLLDCPNIERGRGSLGGIGVGLFAFFLAFGKLSNSEQSWGQCA